MCQAEFLLCRRPPPVIRKRSQLRLFGNQSLVADDFVEATRFADH